MSKRVGVVDLCTSHPEHWVPLFRELGCEVTACWDSGETRLPGYAKEFAQKFNIPRVVAAPEEMLDDVDIVVIHSANWDKHVPLARPFVAAGKAVLVDKPQVGNVKDAHQLLDWTRRGARITGGSCLRFAREARAFLAEPVAERGTPHTVFAGCGVDEFNYGIHAYALAASVLGGGMTSVRHLGTATQQHVRIAWADGRVALLSVGKVAAWLPFYFTAVTEKAVRQSVVDLAPIYRAILECVVPYLTGAAAEPPVPMEVLLEPELAALAAQESRKHGGAEVRLTDLSPELPGYSGTEFAVEYRRARFAPK